MGAQTLGVFEIGLVALLVLVNAAVSLAFQLELGRRLVLASARAVVQLVLLGLVLRWVFDADSPGIILAVMVAMALLSGFEAVRRTSFRVGGLYPLSMAIMLGVSMLITLYGTQLVIGVEPWYAPRYLIPILGMVLGNALNGISLGLESLLSGFKQERAQVEMLLAHGANRAQAGHDVVRRSVRTGMIPILNSMIAAGVISIPGMMTGQILSGEEPLNAAAYQIFILFCIAAGVAMGTVGVVLCGSRLVFDERHRLRLDRVRSLTD